ncbi:hypothetical protein FRB99_003116 [Tulasnella sp. 403]|nr:hypothetical protein FRB99_003116 [Tulasnella sp. 403]
MLHYLLLATTFLALGGIADAAAVLTRRTNECDATAFCPLLGGPSQELHPLNTAYFVEQGKMVKCRYHTPDDASLECAYKIEGLPGADGNVRFTLENSDKQSRLFGDTYGVEYHDAQYKTGDGHCPPQDPVDSDCYLPWNKPTQPAPPSHDDYWTCDLSSSGDNAGGGSARQPTSSKDGRQKKDKNKKCIVM